MVGYIPKNEPVDLQRNIKSLHSSNTYILIGKTCMIHTFLNQSAQKSVGKISWGYCHSKTCQFHCVHFERINAAQDNMCELYNL